MGKAGARCEGGEKMKKEGLGKNEKHPELKGGEIFLTNSTLEDYNCRIGWKTKRMGEIAYDTDGAPINDLFPVFVHLSEIREDRKD